MVTNPLFAGLDKTGLLGAVMKLAETDLTAVAIMVQVPVPEHPLPLQPMNVEPVDATAVKVTAVLIKKA